MPGAGSWGSSFVRWSCKASALRHALLSSAVVRAYPLPRKLRIRSELALDSIDFVRPVARLSEQLALPSPQLDYGKLETLGGSGDRLGQNVAASPPCTHEDGAAPRELRATRR